MQAIAPGATRIGWIGTGVMGAAMAGHVLGRGFALTLTTRTRARAEPLLQRGAAWADTPRAVAEASDVVVLTVGFPEEVRAVVLGPDGVLSAARAPQVLVDMGTTPPSLAAELAAAGADRGVAVVDAPVSGGDVGAREARLAIMAGGDPLTIEALRPLWEAVGKGWTHMGGPGAGQHTKMVNQTLIASTMVGLCEALLYAHRAGLALEGVIGAISGGAAGCWSLTGYGPRILRGDFAPGFLVEHFVKDLGIALDEARRMGLALPGLALAHQLYVGLQAQGEGRRGTQALQLALARLSGVDWPTRG